MIHEIAAGVGCDGAISRCDRRWNFSSRQSQQSVRMHHFFDICEKRQQKCSLKGEQKQRAPSLSHGSSSLAASLKYCLHHWRYLSNPHQLSPTSQVSALAWKKKEKKHVPIALPRQHKGMFDWAPASVRRRWNSTAGRNLRSCTLHQELLFPLLSFSLCCDPFFPSVMAWLLTPDLLAFSAAPCTGLGVWNQIALSRQLTISLCRVSACLSVHLLLSCTLLPRSYQI